MLQLRICTLYRNGSLKPSGSIQWTSGTEQIASIDVVASQREIELSYDVYNDRQRETLAYKIAIEWTRCYFGGQRPWFLCPRCNRRCFTLYSDRIFKCRVCHDLAYASQSDGPLRRNLSQCHRLEKKLGVEPGTGMGWAPRPKGMHHRTYNRLLAQLARADNTWTTSFKSRFHTEPSF